MTEEKSIEPVGIVGAGPVGLTLALRLASFGIPVVIFEMNEKPKKQGSKACLIQGDVLEILDKIDCGEQIKKEGITWHTSHTYIRNKKVIKKIYPERIGFGPFINISQYRIEQILHSKIKENPLIKIKWNNRIHEINQNEKEVAITSTNPNGEKELHFKYLVACDGIHSTVRKITDVNWTGYTHDARFLITDIHVKLPLEKGRHFHYDPSFNPGRQLVMHPQPNDIWRIDWQLAPEENIELERTTGEFDNRIKNVIGNIPYTIKWVSTYRFHQRVVEQFKIFRIFFAGDAAHALPPYGSRGMNSGLQDADNLAWKLASVLKKKTQKSILDTYHTERYAAAKENLSVTETTLKFMVPPSLLHRLCRNISLFLSSTFKIFRKFVNSGKMAEPFIYKDSPIIQKTAKNSLCGHFAPDIFVTYKEEKMRLRKFFGGNSVFLIFLEEGDDIYLYLQELNNADPNNDFIFSLHTVSNPSKKELQNSNVKIVYHDDLDNIYCKNKVSQFYYVRPDGYIAQSWPISPSTFLKTIEDVLERSIQPL